MSAPVVTQFFDHRGLTHLQAALDVAAAKAEDWVATVTYARGPGGGLLIPNLRDVPLVVLEDFYGVAHDELHSNPRMDLSHLCTHRYERGLLVPITRPLGETA